MNETLLYLLERLRRASGAEAIFGNLETLDAVELKAQYRRLVRLVHPDSYPHSAGEAGEALRLLNAFYKAAQQEIDGQSAKQRIEIQIQSPNHSYQGTIPPYRGDLCDLYPVHNEQNQPALLKVVRNPTNNDLLAVEARQLKRLASVLDGAPLRAHFPSCIESFQIVDACGFRRQANVLHQEADTVSQAAIMAAYPNGIHAADMAWMFNRLLAALGTAHDQDIVHGAVIPAHLLVRLNDHNGILVDWCYAVASGGKIAAISPPYHAYYAPEVLAGRPATPATDLYMAAQSMIALLGGDVRSGELPPAVPRPIAALLRACTIPSPHRRIQKAWTLFDDFRELLQRIYRSPKFRPFVMPPSTL